MAPTEPRPAASPAPCFRLTYAPLHGGGPSYAFPCDAAGEVAVEQMSDRAQLNYARVRSLVGREFFSPVVSPVTAD